MHVQTGPEGVFLRADAYNLSINYIHIILECVQSTIYVLANNFSIKNWMGHTKDDIVDLFGLYLKIVIFSLCLSLIIRRIDV